MQPRVVTVRLREPDLAAGDEPSDAAELDGDRLVLDDGRGLRGGGCGGAGTLALGDDDSLAAAIPERSAWAATTRRTASERRWARTGFMT